ncbi:hypothetical protein WG66_010089 [Moniliophthora roreri]|nr:hypothetical protein WG66_010089 [Moniliophthora roreri]
MHLAKRNVWNSRLAALKTTQQLDSTQSQTPVVLINLFASNGNVPPPSELLVNGSKMATMAVLLSHTPLFDGKAAFLGARRERHRYYIQFLPIVYRKELMT